MAGKFLTLDETAQRLGISADEVNRLVDRKQLFPVRDGNTLKFKQDDVEQVAASDAGSGASGDSGLALDLDIDLPQGPRSAAASRDKLSVSLDLGDSVSLSTGDSVRATGSGGPAVSGSGAAPGSLSLDDGLVLDDKILASDAIVVAGSGSGQTGGSMADKSAVTPDRPLAAPSADSPTPEPVTGTLPIDLSGIDVGIVGSNATGSLVMSSSPDVVDLSGSMSNVGTALSGADDGGLSIEDSDARKSGLLSRADFDEDMQSAIRESAAGQSGLAGEDMEDMEEFAPDDIGSDGLADESEADTSGFLNDEASSSTFSDDAPLTGIAGGTGDDLGAGLDLIRDATFSVWQICGLVCCALLMLTGGFVMFDLVRTLGSPEDLSLSSPLLAPMADLFGWR